MLEVRQIVGAGQETLARFTWNTNHLPLTAVDTAGQTNCFGYNANGQLLTTTNARNETVSLAYDANGYLTNITGALPGATTSFTYDGTNRVRTVTDSESYTVTFDYDVLDRPVKITYPDGTFEQIVYKWLDPILHKDRRGHWTATYYDALRRVTDVQDSLSRLTHFQWCGCGSLESITDPLGRTTAWLRDLQGRPTAKIYPDNTQTGYNYESTTSRLKSVTDAKSQITSYAYFSDNNLKQVTYSNAVIATPGVAFTYDASYNRLLTMTDGIGATTNAYYAISTPPALGAGRLASADGPLANDTINYYYDNLGRITNRAINGIAQTAAFDALGRVTVLTNALGRFTNVYVGVTARISTNFYPNGQKTILSYYGATNDFRIQQIQNRSSTNQLSAFSYTYDADGQIATWTQQADTATPQVWAIEYDPVDELLGVTVHSNTVAGAILKKFLYNYDKAANRTGESVVSPGSAGVPPASALAAFNNLNQLTALSGGAAVRWAGHLSETGSVTVASARAVMSARTNFVSYSTLPVGTNVVAITATGPSTNSSSTNYQVIITNNAVAKTLTYDLNGNLTSSVTATSTNTYEWDAADRLSAINSGTNRSEFTYDGGGRRIRIVEKTNGVVQSDKRFLWCGTELCEERASTGATVTKMFFAQGQINYQSSVTNLFYNRDHLGSVREMTDGTGTVRARYDYDPYGRRTRISGDLEADFAFTGHYYHQNSGLYLTLYRAYDSNTAGWMSRDPLAEGCGLNLYAYVANNPIHYVDPLGLSFWSVTGSFAAGLIIGIALAVVVATAAPIVAAIATIALTSSVIGFSATTAAAIVTLGGGLIAVTATTVAVIKIDGDIRSAQQSGNWDQVAFDAGSVVGGLAYSFDQNISWTSEWGKRYKSDLGSGVDWLGTEPTTSASIGEYGITGGCSGTLSPWKWPY